MKIHSCIFGVYALSVKKKELLAYLNETLIIKIKVCLRGDFFLSNDIFNGRIPNILIRNAVL